MTEPQASAADWRRVIAALANPEARVLAARLMLDEDVSEALEAHAPSRRAHLRSTLVGSGLATDANGTLAANPDVFRALLAQSATPKRTGVDRFIHDGRLTQYPAGAADRDAVHAWLVAQTLAPGESVTEREFNTRLARHVTDPASFRRYLVDATLVHRSPDGRTYTAPTS